MDAPEGAIIKPWGWQKQVMQCHDREIWYGEATVPGASTSLHSHARHMQTLRVLEGSLVCVDATNKKIHVANCADAIPTMSPNTKHRLVFGGLCRFIEVYHKHGWARGDCPSVTEDTIREGV